jgi:hypothetical protein
VISSETLAELELILTSAAVLTLVSIAREQKRIGYLTPELARDVDESDEPDYRRFGDRECSAAYHASPVRFNDLRLAVENQPESTTDGNERERLK